MDTKELRDIINSLEQVLYSSCGEVRTGSADNNNILTLAIDGLKEFLFKLTQPQQTINLAELEDKLDKALDSETSESIKKWLNEQRQPQQTVSDEEIRAKAEKYFMEKIKPLHDAFDSMDMVYGVMMEREIYAIADLMRDKLQAQTNEGEYWYLKGYEDRAKLSNLIFDETSKQHALTQFKALQNTK